LSELEWTGAQPASQSGRQVPGLVVVPHSQLDAFGSIFFSGLLLFSTSFFPFSDTTNFFCQLLPNFFLFALLSENPNNLPSDW
jgi:hypothetical protein